MRRKQPSFLFLLVILFMAVFVSDFAVQRKKTYNSH
uniref:Uncharacterized protein n=1 Tax=Anguilla anguilla TaxID=7936 RepID=A0A0E9U870_ANGAN